MAKTPSFLAANIKYFTGRDKENPISVNVLAEAAGMEQTTVNRWANGRVTNPRDETVQPLADYLGVSVADLKYTDLSAAKAAGKGSQFGRPDPATLRHAMRLLSFVSQIQTSPIDFSEDVDAFLAAYDLVSHRPSEFNLEDASKRMGEWLRARGQNG